MKVIFVFQMDHYKINSFGLKLVTSKTPLWRNIRVEANVKGSSLLLKLKHGVVIGNIELCIHLSTGLKAPPLLR